jgi:exopolysaccharide biosynthesis protein
MRTWSCLGALVLVAALEPARGSTPASWAPALRWAQAGNGLAFVDYDVPSGTGSWRTRIVAVRVDPARLRFRLRARLEGVDPAWSVDRAPAGAVLAVNAGQFNGITPWGWVVMDGEEMRPPGSGPLSVAIAWDREGRVHWLAPGEIERERARGRMVEAFQSFPVLMDESGRVPRPIREPGLGVDVAHNDTRLAIGMGADGHLVVAITRFNGLGPISPAVPLGLTLSQMADVMRELGCVRAVSLDGGVSAQLLLNANGTRQVWRAWRSVPLGLVAESRQQPLTLGARVRKTGGQE